MNTQKKFEEFVQEGVVRKVRTDKERAQSLITEAERKLKALRVRKEKIGIEDENANDYIESCYDVIMFLVRAKLLKDGYSASGQRAHEAEVSYLRIFGFNEQEVAIADKLRYYRNGMLYYGKSLDKEYALIIWNFLDGIYEKLKETASK